MRLLLAVSKTQCSMRPEGITSNGWTIFISRKVTARSVLVLFARWRCFASSRDVEFRYPQKPKSAPYPLHLRIVWGIIVTCKVARWSLRCSMRHLLDASPARAWPVRAMVGHWLIGHTKEGMGILMGDLSMSEPSLTASMAMIGVSMADAAAFGSRRHPFGLHFAVVGIGPSAFSQTPTRRSRHAERLASMPLSEFF